MKKITDHFDRLPEPVKKTVYGKSGSGQALPSNLKAGVESLSGMDMSAVRVHYNSQKPAQIKATSYAVGNDIHIAPGQEKHLPHEAWHVVQQKQGRVKQTTEVSGITINTDEALEKEADAMGARALKDGTK